MDSIGPHDPIRAVTAFEPATILPSATVAEVAAAMRVADCGALLVEQRTGEPGVVTERDLVWGLADHGPDSGDWVVDIMTREVITVSADSSIVDAVEVMMEAGISHLVVVDDETGRRGMVSVRDVLEPLVNAVEPLPATERPGR
jgi:CBS domain-containing protein